MPTLLLVAAVVLLLIYLFRNATAMPENFPPGPRRLPLCLNYILVLLKNYKYPYEVIHELTKVHKSKVVGFYFGHLPVVAVCDYNSIKEVLVRPEFQGRADTVALVHRSYGKQLGVFFVEGPFWLEQRRFALRHMRDYGFGRRSAPLELEINAELQDLIDLIKGNRTDDAVCASDGTILLPDALDPAFINALLVVFTGTRMPRSGDKFARILGKKAMQLQKSSDSTGGFLKLYPWLRFFFPKLSGYHDATQGSYFVRDFLRGAVDEQEKSFSDEHMRHFIDVYLSELKKQEKSGLPTSFSIDQLVITLFDFFFPTASALSTTLAFALIHVFHHPEVQVKVQSEIDEVVGRGRLPTLDDRQRMPYTESTLRESMRIRTLTPISLPHKATEDTYLQGYFIPKGSILLTLLSSLHMDEDLWGDPKVFRPSRFLDDNGQLKKKDFSLPFGAGKRLCAGETFARQNLFLMFSALMQNFTIASGKNCKIPSFDSHIPGVIETPPSFWARFIPR